MSRIGTNEDSIQEFGEFYPKLHFNIIRIREVTVSFECSFFSTLPPEHIGEFKESLIANISINNELSFGSENKKIDLGSLSIENCYADTDTYDKYGEKIYKFSFRGNIEYPTGYVAIGTWYILGYITFNSTQKYIGRNTLTYEKILVDGEVPPQVEDIMVDKANFIYKEEKILSLNGKYYKSETITQNYIIENTQTIINNLQLSSLEALSSANAIMMTAKSSGDLIITELNKVISSINSVNCSPETLKLVKAVRPLPIEYDRRLIRSGELQKKRLGFVKVFDNRDNVDPTRIVSKISIYNPATIGARNIISSEQVSREIAYSYYPDGSGLGAEIECLPHTQIYSGHLVADVSAYLNKRAVVRNFFNMDVLTSIFGFDVMKTFFKPKNAEIQIIGQGSQVYNFKLTTIVSYWPSNTQYYTCQTNNNFFVDREGNSYYSYLRMANPKFKNVISFNDKKFSQEQFYFFDYQIVSKELNKIWIGPITARFKIDFEDSTEKIYRLLVVPIIQELKNETIRYHDAVDKVCNFNGSTKLLTIAAKASLKRQFASDKPWSKISFLLDLITSIFDINEDGESEISRFLGLKSTEIFRKYRYSLNESPQFPTRQEVLSLSYLAPDLMNVVDFNSYVDRILNLCDQLLRIPHFRDEKTYLHTDNNSLTEQNLISNLFNYPIGSTEIRDTDTNGRPVAIEETLSIEPLVKDVTPPDPTDFGL